MSKEFPEDIDYREATPCPMCGCELECFNSSQQPTWMACPNCNAPNYEKTRAIMRFDEIKLDWGEVIAVLKAGPETIKIGTMKELVDYATENGFIVDGMNFSLYQKVRDEQRTKLEQHAAEVKLRRTLEENDGDEIG